jgi:hypothetical protein
MLCSGTRRPELIFSKEKVTTRFYSSSPDTGNALAPAMEEKGIGLRYGSEQDL